MLRVCGNKRICKRPLKMQVFLRARLRLLHPFAALTAGLLSSRNSDLVAQKVHTFFISTLNSIEP